MFWQLRSSIIRKFNAPFSPTPFNNNLQLAVQCKHLATKVQEITDTTQSIMIMQKIITRRNILHQCKLHYHLREVEVITPASNQFFLEFTAGWSNYTPLKTLKFYSDYKKTTNLELVHKFLGVKALNRRFSIPKADQLGDDLLDVTVQTSEHRPFRALYNPVYQQMLLSFYYFPYPRSELWRPAWRADIKKRNDANISAIQVYKFF